MKYYLFNILSLLLLLSSCSLIEDAPAVCPPETEDTFTMSFQMTTPVNAPDSRSDSQGHPEVDNEYDRFENGIDLNNIALFIFAKVAGTSDPEKLVLSSSNLTQDPYLDITGSEGQYTVSLKINRTELKDAIGIDIDPNSGRNIVFRMLMLVNHAPAAIDWTSVTATTFTGVIDRLNASAYPMSAVYTAPAVTTPGGSATSPEGDVTPPVTATTPDGVVLEPDVRDIYGKQQFIPMFGTNTFMVTQEQLYYSRPENRIFLGELTLLRSLAKVRLIDNIQIKDADGYPKIVAANIGCTQSSATILPADAASYVNATQVHATNLANPGSTDGLPEYALGVSPLTWMNPSLPIKGDLFIGYIPEQPITYLNPADLTYSGYPVLNITLATACEDNGDHHYETYSIRFTQLMGTAQNPGFGNNILRNHIYTISINAAESVLTIQVKVVPWIGVSMEYTFGFDDLIVWDRNNPKM